MADIRRLSSNAHRYAELGTESAMSDKESKSPSLWLDLLRYPVLALSIVLAVIALKHFLGLEFGPVTELGTQGVKFAEQSKATLEAIAELEANLNEAMVRIEAIEKEDGKSVTASNQVEREAASAAQTVSDTTAQLARLQSAKRPSGKRLKGYIWIGNYNAEGWEQVMLAGLDTGQPIQIPPDRVVEGTSYTTLGNIVLRDGLPANDALYFRGRASAVFGK